MSVQKFEVLAAMVTEVRRCRQCPAFLKHGAKCNLNKERTIYTPLNAPPPEWCPLRQQPVMLVLKEK